MNVDNNQADLDLFIDTLINKHNDILDTLLSNYLLKNRQAYTQLLGNLLGPSHTVIVDDNSDKRSATLVQCADCSHSAKFANLTELTRHLVEYHDHQPLQLSRSLLHTCLDQLTKACTHDHDELKRFLVSHNRHFTTDSIHYTISRLTLGRMNKTFTLNKSPPAVNKLAFSAESLLNNQPSAANAQTQLLTYFKSAQMASTPQPSPLFNQFFLPFMLSSSSAAAAAAGPGPGSPPDNDDQLDESLELSGGPTTPGAINRRRRTRITEQQLKILRQYFDINKSPSDDQVVDIARQTQLQAKVIKHWFRNTLFKERQKDKDSPYNFNNPPLTQLNLEEYEKTGKVVAEPAAPPLANSLNESTTESNETSEHLNVDLDEAELEATITSSRCSSVGGQKHRPNRTKFSEAQSKALSAAFKLQKYPKDEQISQLSGQLGLKPRVITVWFQNARQKARKCSGAANGADDPNDYYDLNDDDCDEIHSHVSSSTDKSSPAADPALAFAASNKALQLQLAMSLLAAHQHQQQLQHGDKLTSSSSAASSSSSTSSSSSSSSKKDDDDEELDDDDQDDDEDGDDDADETDSAANVAKSAGVAAAAQSAVNKSGSAKRLRTTILPEQQEFLMQKYQLDQNPSRKMLDEIAKQVRLKKRVVQVWFQNTRARERKGIIKVASPVCAQTSPNVAKWAKKCTMCSLTFRSRNDLESHFILKHNFSFEQANSALHNATPDTDTANTTNTTNATPSNGLNSILMSTLFAQLQQQQQQQHQQQQQQPFDLSFKVKAMGRENGAERSRSNSGSGGNKVNMLSQKQAMQLSSQQQQQQQQQRRVRTQMTQYQVNVMRLIFAEYKTPTMNECELMGKEINLKKRVVQVWFQNARAKEKKNAAHKSILFSNSANNDLSNFEFASDQCLLCGVKYSSAGATLSQQQREHLFSKQHLAKLVQFVTKIAMDNGANSVDFSAKSGAKHGDEDEADDDDSELDDDVNTDDDHDHTEPSQLNESHESKPPPPPPPPGPPSSSFDINRLLQMPSQTAPNCQLYNYFLYSNLLAQQPKVAAASSDSSSSSSCSPPFFPQLHNPMLAQLYAAFAAQHHAQSSATLDSLNVAKSVRADIEKELGAPPPGPHTIRYTVDGSTKHDLIDKHNVDPGDLDEHTQATQYVCRACKSVSLSRDALLAHQCPNPPLNKSLAHANLVKLEQIAYKCVTCAAEAHADSVFANAADFLQHSNHLGHKCLNSKRKEHHVHLDSNNNKKIKY